jgi:hypothetical protein
MTKRKRRSKAEWRELVEQQKHSGLSGVAFCDQLGLSRKTFYLQRKSLAQKPAGPEAGQFIKVNPRTVKKMSVPAAAVLHYRDSRLQLPVGADPTWVAELMKALA